MAAFMPAIAAIERNVASISRRSGMPNEMFDAPQLTFTPSSWRISRTVSNNEVAASPAAPIGIAGPVSVVSPVRYRDRGDGTLEIPLRRGQEVLVHPRGRRPDLAVRPVAITTPGMPWGLPA